MLVPLTGVEGGGLNSGSVGVLQSRVHGFSTGTVHTVRDDVFCFLALSVFSFVVPGDILCRGKDGNDGTAVEPLGGFALYRTLIERIDHHCFVQFDMNRDGAGHNLMD